MRGAKVSELKLTENKPDDDELTKLVVGPSGKLRAPTIRIGKTLIVGFHEETWAGLLL